MVIGGGPYRFAVIGATSLAVATNHCHVLGSDAAMYGPVNPDGVRVLHQRSPAETNFAGPDFFLPQLNRRVHKRAALFVTSATDDGVLFSPPFVCLLVCLLEGGDVDAFTLHQNCLSRERTLGLGPGFVTLASVSTFWPRTPGQNFGFGLGLGLEHFASFIVTVSSITRNVTGGF